jgi:membrane protein YdbS with pleckstrin-like domain
MRDLPSAQLDPKVKHVWRINDALWLTIVFAVPFAISMVAHSVSAQSDDASFASIVIGVLYVVSLIIWLGVLPPIRYMRWRYEVNEDYLDIARGIIWRKRFIIPFIRVQNTDTRQGPLQRAFRLESVTVSTAAGNHEIPGLDLAVAEHLRDRTAELARLAREDV